MLRKITCLMEVIYVKDIHINTLLSMEAFKIRRVNFLKSNRHSPNERLVEKLGIEVG